jgi:hypothetical protein
MVVGVSMETATYRPRAAPADCWWPSRFGADDEHGMLNHVDDAKRRDALGLVREGRMYDLGRVLDDNVPVFPGRYYFRQTLVTTAHGAADRYPRPARRRRGAPRRRASRAG